MELNIPVNIPVRSSKTSHELRKVIKNKTSEKNSSSKEKGAKKKLYDETRKKMKPLEKLTLSMLKSHSSSCSEGGNTTAPRYPSLGYRSDYEDQRIVGDTRGKPYSTDVSTTASDAETTTSDATSYVPSLTCEHSVDNASTTSANPAPQETLSRMSRPREFHASRCIEDAIARIDGREKRLLQRTNRAHRHSRQVAALAGLKPEQLPPTTSHVDQDSTTRLNTLINGRTFIRSCQNSEEDDLGGCVGGLPLFRDKASRLCDAFTLTRRHSRKYTRCYPSSIAYRLRQINDLWDTPYKTPPHSTTGEEDAGSLCSMQVSTRSDKFSDITSAIRLPLTLSRDDVDKENKIGSRKHGNGDSLSRRDDQLSSKPSRSLEYNSAKESIRPQTIINDKDVGTDEGADEGRHKTQKVSQGITETGHTNAIFMKHEDCKIAGENKETTSTRVTNTNEDIVQDEKEIIRGINKENHKNVIASSKNESKIKEISSLYEIRSTKAKVEGDLKKRSLSNDNMDYIKRKYSKMNHEKERRMSAEIKHEKILQCSGDYKVKRYKSIKLPSKLNNRKNLTRNNEAILPEKITAHYHKYNRNYPYRSKSSSSNSHNVYSDSLVDLDFDYDAARNSRRRSSGRSRSRLSQLTPRKAMHHQRRPRSHNIVRSWSDVDSFASLPYNTVDDRSIEAFYPHSTPKMAARTRKILGKEYTIADEDKSLKMSKNVTFQVNNCDNAKRNHSAHADKRSPLAKVNERGDGGKPSTKNTPRIVEEILSTRSRCMQIPRHSTTRLHQSYRHQTKRNNRDKLNFLLADISPSKCLPNNAKIRKLAHLIDQIPSRNQYLRH